MAKGIQITFDPTGYTYDIYTSSVGTDGSYILYQSGATGSSVIVSGTPITGDFVYVKLICDGCHDQVFRVPLTTSPTPTPTPTAPTPTPTAPTPTPTAPTPTPTAPTPTPTAPTPTPTAPTPTPTSTGPIEFCYEYSVQTNVYPSTECPGYNDTEEVYTFTFRDANGNTINSPTTFDIIFTGTTAFYGGGGTYIGTFTVNAGATGHTESIWLEQSVNGAPACPCPCNMNVYIDTNAIAPTNIVGDYTINKCPDVIIQFFGELGGASSFDVTGYVVKGTVTDNMTWDGLINTYTGTTCTGTPKATNVPFTLSFSIGDTLGHLTHDVAITSSTGVTRSKITGLNLLSPSTTITSNNQDITIGSTVYRIQGFETCELL